MKGRFLFLVLCLSIFCGAAVWAPAQTIEHGNIVMHRTVNLVQLDVAVMDKKGNYVSDLHPWNFTIYEDGIPQKLAIFGEENGTPVKLSETDSAGKESDPKLVKTWASSLNAGHSVFILFDTSNYMYRSFVFAQDATAEFIRSLNRSDHVAFYSYSRDLSRGALLTSNQSQILRGVRATVAGDDAALYNSLLLTLKDAAQSSGRKVVVVFSNGPDNASVVAPEDVLELAQADGIPIYMVSTQQAKDDPVSTAVFERVAAGTGGKAYFAKNWEEQQKAFASIRDDLAHLYSLGYYPQPNPNHGWRKITVKLVGVHLKKYRIRTRTGYRPDVGRFAADSIPIP